MKRQWRKATKSDGIRIEEFLRSHEYYCVTACAKFLRRQSPHEQIWYLANQDGAVSAMLLRFAGMIFPVFGSTRDLPPPRFMKRFTGRIPLHAVQGLLDEAETLEAALGKLGYRIAEHRNYDLMTLDGPPERVRADLSLRGLTLRRPGFTDLEAMYPIQAAYEKEEVLPRGAAFNPAVCRLSLSSILVHEQSLIACMGDRIVGKINTNAASFTRLQIGGVYVLPEYRNQGIGRRMTAAFAGDLITQGRGLTLFVKKDNPAAQRIYRQVGFKTIGDYRISYY